MKTHTEHTFKHYASRFYFCILYWNNIIHQSIHRVNILVKLLHINNSSNKQTNDKITKKKEEENIHKQFYLIHQQFL